MAANPTVASPVSTGTSSEFDPNDERTWPIALRPAEVVQIDRRNLNEFYAKARAGTLPYRVIKDGSRYLVPRSGLLAWLDGEPEAA